MPVYIRESEANVRACLGSLERQECPPDQLVVVEDGPIQGSVARVLDEWGSRLPITRVKLEANRGLGPALAAGLRACRHNMVARMDADDVAVPERFRVQLEAFASKPGLHIVGGQIEEFHDDASRPGSMRVVPEDHAEIERRALYRNPMNHMTVMFRKAAVESVGGYRDFPGYEDYDLWLRALSGGLRLGNVPCVLVRARTGEGFLARRRGWPHVLGEWRLGGAKRATALWVGPAVAAVTFSRMLARILPQAAIGAMYSRFLR